MTESAIRLVDVNGDGVMDVLFGFATGISIAHWHYRTRLVFFLFLVFYNIISYPVSYTHLTLPTTPYV